MKGMVSMFGFTVVKTRDLKEGPWAVFRKHPRFGYWELFAGNYAQRKDAVAKMNDLINTGSDPDKFRVMPRTWDGRDK
jgi:hypothetical protein